MPINNDTRVRDNPEPGMFDKLAGYANMIVEPNAKGKLLAIGAIALAAIVLFKFLPMMNIDILSSQTSFSSLAVFVAIALVGGVGILGLVSHNSKSKMLATATEVAKAILPILLTGLALWWGIDTMRTLADQGNWGTGPFWFAFLAIGAGAYNAYDILKCLIAGKS